jgi:hypothetical protein
MRGDEGTVGSIALPEEFGTAFISPGAMDAPPISPRHQIDDPLRRAISLCFR